MDCEQLFLRIDKKTIDMYTGGAPSVFNPVLNLSNPSLAPWVMQMKMLASSAYFTRIAERSPTVCAEFERLFIALLLAGQPHQHVICTDNKKNKKAIAPGSVRRAESYIDAHYGDALSLEDISNAAGISSRALLFSFRKFRNTTPMQHLHSARLHHAKKRLESPSTNVTEIALECGFTHLGRFAKSYRELFGEMPSETIKNTRRKHLG